MNLNMGVHYGYSLELLSECLLILIMEAGRTQSIYRLATGWTAEGSEFESR
jgi:hypothetical protein